MKFKIIIYPFIYIIKIIISYLSFSIWMLIFTFIMSITGVLFRDISQLIPAVLQISFLTSPIMFPSSVLSNYPGILKNLILINPFYIPISNLRDTLINESSLYDLFNFLILYLFLLLIVLRLFWKLRKRVVFEL